MDKIAVFIKKYSIGKSSPVICMLDLLSDYYELDLFVQDVWYTSADVLRKGRINLIEVENKEGKNMFSRMKKLFYTLSDKDKKQSRNICKDSYRSYICFDPYGFLLCKELFPEARPFYYSLELYFKDDHFNLEYPENVMKRERSEINTIKGLVIQSHEREMLFRKENKLSNEIPTLLLPVTYLQPSVKERSNMLRERYNINSNKRIVLHLGGIQEYHSCVEQAMAFSELTKWVLIFHGYHFGNYIKKLKSTIKKNNIKNVIISDEVYERIEDMDPILMSCDMGIAWYNNVSLNFTTAGKSSGKISAYMRFGLPIIAKKYDSSIEAIEKPGCGLCVNEFDEIKAAIEKIDGKYNYYSTNCLNEYDKVYWFENYKKDILNFFNLD